MNNCLHILSRFARTLAVVGILAGTAGLAAAQSPQEAAPQKYLVTATGEKIPLYSGIQKHAGTITALDGPTIINNRVDSNAILNLDEHPLDAAPKAEVPPATAPKNVVAASSPAPDLNAQLTDAKARYAQATADLNAAQNAKDQTKTVAARHDVAVAKSDIDRLTNAIESANKQPAAK